jgi:regulator of protease activity HflC (stomatin/prohibitin superfamily)
MQVFFQVPQSHVVALTRFGKFSRLLPQGLHARIPLLESVYYVNWGNIANKEGCYIELTEQIIDTKPKECHTKDNVPVTIDAAIYWRIIDVAKALFEVDILPRSLIDSCLNALRAEIGKLSLDQVLSSRRELSERVAASLLDISTKWGVSISRVEIQELKTTDDTADAMRMEMAAERKRRAAVLEAEGIAEARKKTAEAEAYAIKIKADAEAEYINKLSETLGPDQVSKLLMIDKILEGYKSISQSPSSKVFLPANVQTILESYNLNKNSNA